MSTSAETVSVSSFGEARKIRATIVGVNALADRA
jgi:hypothetical protein